SGRVFPRAMKASPLLRAWLRRLDGLGVRFEPGSRWTGWDGSGRLLFSRQDGTVEAVAAAACVLALGGASWARLGSDGGWTGTLEGRGIRVTPLQPSNAGVEIAWSQHFRERFAGEPLKPAAFTLGGRPVRGEAVVTAHGLEGGAIYSFSAAARRALASGPATLEVDLRPESSVDQLAARLAAIPSRQSLSNGLRKALRLSPLAIALLREDASG
ncbi:NAD(P)/FAD-dependent oxidoreductase, partial [Nostoc sp. NIES-2111]